MSFSYLVEDQSMGITAIHKGFGDYVVVLFKFIVGGAYSFASDGLAVRYGAFSVGGMRAVVVEVLKVIGGLYVYTSL